MTHEIAEFIPYTLGGSDAASATVPGQSAASDPAQSKYLMCMFGTYTGPNSKGIYAYRYDAKTGKLDSIGLAGELVRPSFLTIHPNGRFLYAVSELGNDGRVNGSITAFAIDRKSGALTALNTVSSGGGGSCHLVVDKTGKALVVANYGSGSVAAFTRGIRRPFERPRFRDKAQRLQH